MGHLCSKCYWPTSKLPDGGYRLWWPNGRLKVQCYFLNDKKEGESKWWFENGQLHKHCYYRDGKKEGEYKKWYENGQIQEHCYYSDGKLEGEYKTWWFENGQLFRHCYYRNNIKICELTGDTVSSIIKLQRSFRNRRSLKKYLNSRQFIEWWYSPSVKGGITSKKELADFADEIFDK